MLPAEGFQPTLSKLAAILDRLGIRLHVTGGLTTVAYAEPRLTQDIDLVLDAERVLEAQSLVLVEAAGVEPVPQRR